eukprot:6210955-Pleurochrysis_carterae.AAC.2
MEEDIYTFKRVNGQPYGYAGQPNITVPCGKLEASQTASGNRFSSFDYVYLVSGQPGTAAHWQNLQGPGSGKA